MKFIEITLVIFLFFFSFLVNFYFGHIGLMPLDDLQNFNSGHRVLKGDFPFRDYYSITGPLLDIWQSYLYKFFGTSWQTFLLHASVLNFFYSLSLYFFIKRELSDQFVALLFGISGGLLMYPTAGNPTVEHSSLILSLIAFLFFITGLKERKNLNIFISIFIYCLAFFTKQVPTLYFVFLSLIIYFSQVFSKINFIDTFKFFVFTLIIFFVLIFYFFLNGVLIYDIFYQYIIIAFNLGESRFSNLNSHIIYENLSKIFFLFILIIPSIYFLLKKREISNFIIITGLVLIIGIYEIHSNNQPITFALLPIFVFLILDSNQKYKSNDNFLKIFFHIIIFYCFFRILRFEIYYIFGLIIILTYLFFKKKLFITKNLIFVYFLISTLFYFEKYIKTRAWDDLNKEKMSTYLKGENIHDKLKFLKWRTVYFDNLTDEKNLINSTFNFLKNLDSDTNYILISDYQIYNVILDRKDFSPVKYWFSDATYPSKNKKLRKKFEDFFKSKIIDNNISLIIIDNTAKFKTNELNEFIWLNHCLEKIKFDKNSNVDIFNIKKNCL